MTNCLTTACIACYIFRSQNALKLTYVHVQFQKISGGDTPGPPALARRGGCKTPSGEILATGLANVKVCLFELFACELVYP